MLDDGHGQLPQSGPTVNAEPRGSVLLPVLATLDVRVGRFFNIGRHRSS